MPIHKTCCRSASRPKGNASLSPCIPPNTDPLSVHLVARKRGWAQLEYPIIASIHLLLDVSHYRHNTDRAQSLLHIFIRGLAHTLLQPTQASRKTLQLTRTSGQLSRCVPRFVYASGASKASLSQLAQPSTFNIATLINYYSIACRDFSETNVDSTPLGL